MTQQFPAQIGWLDRFERTWRSIATRRALSILIAGLLPLAGRALLLPVMPIPKPAVHDEFSYLLAAETFAKVRLTNPTPPMWVHFETFHELMTPTYMSVYSPGQGVTLALGKVLFGHPWWAVYMSIGIMCASLTWMLYAWVPPAWALLGGLLAAFQFGFAHYWMNAYWGGSLAAIGGCLVLGAFPRIQQRMLIPYSLALGSGLALLSATRPFEGGILGLTVAGALIFWLARQPRPSLLSFLLRVAAPAFLLLAPALIFVLVETKAVSTSFTKMPHELYRSSVAVWPTFAFERPNWDHVYHHEVLRKFFTEWEPDYQDAKDWGTWKGLIPGIRERMRTVGACYFPTAVYLPIALVSLLAMAFRRMRLLAAAILASLAGNALVNWLVPHYLAPVLGAMMAVHLEFLRFVTGWRWRGKRIGIALVGITLGLLMVLFAFRIATRVHLGPPNWVLARASIQHVLESRPGQHLVFVRYAPNHVLQDEWVFNGPDIEHSKVIWARSMSAELDEELRRYFHDSDAWIVDADGASAAIKPWAGR